MNMFARFDENPAMTLRVIKETKRYGRTDNVKTVYPLQTKFAGGIKITKMNALEAKWFTILNKMTTRAKNRIIFKQHLLLNLILPISNVRYKN